MENNYIFGDDIVLPSLPDLKSGCENELYALMREVDAEFAERNAVIENLMSQVNAQQVKNVDTSYREEKINSLTKELERLKKENSFLKKENDNLQRRTEKGRSCEYELEMLKKKLQNAEGENKNLKNKYFKLEEKYEDFQRLLVNMASPTAVQDYLLLQGDQSNQDRPNSEAGCEGYDELHTKVCEAIDELQKRINEKFS